MANLAKLYGMQQKTDVDSMVSKAIDAAMKRIVGGIDSTINEERAKNERAATEKVLSDVGAITPALGKLISDSIQTAVQSIVAEIAKIEPLGDLKGMVKGIRIPDHTGHLAALQQAISSISIPETDLKPIMKQIEALSAKLDEDEEEEEPKKWVFTVNRDEITKLMESVEVTQE